MKHIIDKSFDFCYGHRVHNQRLNTKFTESGNACLACRHLHGHQGKIKIFLEETVTGVNIQKTGMVTDFKHLGWMKNFVDDILDHKFIMDLQDPLFKSEFPILSPDDLMEMPQGYFIPSLQRVKNWCENTGIKGKEANAIFEKYEGAVFVDFVPTSENLAGWLLQIAIKKMQPLKNVKVCAVEYWETPKSHCRVEA